MDGSWAGRSDSLVTIAATYAHPAASVAAWRAWLRSIARWERGWWLPVAGAQDQGGQLLACAQVAGGVGQAVVAVAVVVVSRWRFWPGHMG